MIPEYDFNTLPAIEHPFSNEQEATKKYLGGRAITGDIYATLNVFMVDNTESRALFDFWQDDCNYGTIPFYIALPLFGNSYDKDKPNVLAKFIEDVSIEKLDIHWKNSIKIKVIGTIDYIVDDNNDFIVDDSNNYIHTDGISNSNKEISYD